MGERECAGGFGIVVAHDCEIPAFAGMVCGCTEVCWWILAIAAVNIKRCGGIENQKIPPHKTLEPIAVIDSCRPRVAVRIRICR